MTLCGEISGARMRTRIPGVSDCGSGTSPSAAIADVKAITSTSALQRLILKNGVFLYAGMSYSRGFESYWDRQNQKHEAAAILDTSARLLIPRTTVETAPGKIHRPKFPFCAVRRATEAHFRSVGSEPTAVPRPSSLIPAIK